MTTLTIVQLYPDLLGVTGDRGNVAVLQSRLASAGITAQVATVHAGEPLPDEFDIVVIGNGPLSAMRRVADDLSAKAEPLRAHVDAGGVIFAVGGGAELLSTGVQTLDGDAVPGLGLLPFRVRRTRQRRVGYIVADTEDGELIGFEDHASTWDLDAGASVYGRVAAGKGSIGPEGLGGESVRSVNAFATNVQGPVLPLNPQLADAVLRAACARRGVDYVPGGSLANADALAEAARTDIRRLTTGKKPTVMSI
ncbi:MAG: glutamine amidotransferase [Microbacterium sp.]